MAKATGFTVWITGMLGAGKTTMANYIAARLRQVDRDVEVLDEDELKELFWEEVEDNKAGRQLIVRRIGVMADMLTRHGAAVVVAAISPYKTLREEQRRLVGKYVEVFMDCPTEKLVQRDTTGKYKKALNGEIPHFIGITDPYEPPTFAEVTSRSDTETVEDAAERVFQMLLNLTYLSADDVKTILGKKLKATAVVKPKGKLLAFKKAPKAAKPAKKAAGKKRK